jgi:hypothetical protein
LWLAAVKQVRNEVAEGGLQGCDALAKAYRARGLRHDDDTVAARSFEFRDSAESLALGRAREFVLNLLDDPVGLVLRVAGLGIARKRIVRALLREGIANWKLDNAAGQRMSFCLRQ